MQVRITNLPLRLIFIKNRAGCFIQRAELKDGECVLDVGCGTGITSRAISVRLSAEGRIVAVDRSQVQLAVARKYVEHQAISFIHSDGSLLGDSHIFSLLVI